MAVWRSKSGKLLIPIIAGVLVLVAVGGVCFLKFKGKGNKHEKPKAVVEATTSLEMGDMVVNLADTSEPHYLKVNIVLEVAGTVPESGGEGEGEEKGASPKMRDAVIEALSARTFSELLTPEGKNALKESIKALVNKTLGDEAKVTEVFFSDFAMQ